MKNILNISFIIVFSLFFLFSCSVSRENNLQQKQNTYSSHPTALRILFWNLENLFDVHNDSLKNDDEFSWNGVRYWNSERYKMKITNLWKSIIFFGKGKPPEILGFCEIENQQVLKDILVYSPFGMYGYQFVHFESPDLRGIDVALAYDPNTLKLIQARPVNIIFEQPDARPTRDILYTKFLHQMDTLHIFVNHWPSKYGGAGYTEPFRRKAAETLREQTDSIHAIAKGQGIICMGDFNDTPDSYSINQILCASGDHPMHYLKPINSAHWGTIRYQGQWQLIDHFFVNRTLLNRSQEDFIDSLSVSILIPEFLLETDEKYGGLKPFRTWVGYRYNGGISDHLPVILEVYRREW